MLGTIILVIIVLALLGGAFPFGPWSGAPAAPYYHGYGYGWNAGGLLVTVLVIVLVLALLGHI